ncbi:hypothetical protein TA3x_000764 [Tundrisphaera sp. TA3]|uniref:hypothetical protein n=1 Tax=Tundrisphaera sp. TA3 TaxID=3435775 RepID=UPI003EB8B377
MSTQTQPILVGLAASGLFWLTTPVVMGQGGPAPQAPSSSQAAPEPSKFSVMLLTNGKVVRGAITRDAAGLTYILKDQGVPIAYPSVVVEKAAGSIEELYQYRLSRLAERDEDERMKLARWCLTEGLTDRAKEQIAAILELSPGHTDAIRMQYSMAAAADRPSPVDPEVRRTSGSMPEGGEPAPLNQAAIKRLRRDFGSSNAPPVIFDLPTAQAVSRARDFTQQIHPILQNRCAGCHNERYQGSFQLVVAKGRRDMNPDVARANLDATLQLVNPDDLPRSSLLSAGLVPHGNSKNAIFKGPNDYDYRKLEFWVRALRPAPVPGESVAQAGYAGPQPAAPPQDGFAADRQNRPAAPGMPLTPVVPVPRGDGFPPLPGTPTADPNAVFNPPPGYLPGDNYRINKDYSGGVPDSEFQVPFAAGGALPPAVQAAQKQANANRQAPPPQGSNPAMAAAPAVVPTTATKVDERTVLVAPTEDSTQLPGMNLPRYPPKNPAAEDGKAPRTKVDPKLLELMIKQRNGTP